MSEGTANDQANAQMGDDPFAGTGLAAGDGGPSVGESAPPHAATGSEVELSREHHMVTALAVRVAGSAVLAEQMGAAEWSAVVSGVVARCRSTIPLHGGRVVELLNDGLLALFWRARCPSA